MRNKYFREDTWTHETLKILDDSILESDEEIDADPYNTCRFDRQILKLVSSPKVSRQT